MSPPWKLLDVAPSAAVNSSEWIPYGKPAKATSGPILVQGFLQYLCQGVIISQGAKFYHRWDDDPVALRVYVVVLLLFSLLQTILESYKTWVETIDASHWWTSPLHFTEFLCNSLICSLCEAFLIRRCYRITQKNLSVLAFLCALFIVTTIASIVLTFRIAKVIGPLTDNGHADPLHASVYAYPLWVYATLVTALSLTTILSVSLWTSRTGLRHLDRTLNHIIFITFESAALPAACMLASAVFYSIRDARASETSSSSTPAFSLPPSSSSGPPPSPPSGGAMRGPMFAQTLHLDLFFAILTGKVYTLGLLRTLNSRTQFRAGIHTSHLGRRSLTGWNWADADAAEGGRAPRGSVATVRFSVPRDPRVPENIPEEEEGPSDCDRSSEETVRAGMVGESSLAVRGDDGGCPRLESVPSAHLMAPKARKSVSKASARTPEYGGSWRSPP